MKKVSGLAVLVLTLVLQACLSSSVALQVAPDGSGRAVITSRVYEQALQDFETISSVAPAQRKSAEESMPPPTESELSSHFGTPVRLESTELEKTADGVIRKTVVTFPDITQVRLQFPPVITFPAGGSFGMSGVTEPPVITFAMRPQANGDRLLLVRMPDNPVEAEQHTSPPDTEVKPDSNPVMDRNVRRAIKPVGYHTPGQTITWSPCSCSVSLRRCRSPTREPVLRALSPRTSDDRCNRFLAVTRSASCNATDRAIRRGC